MLEIARSLFRNEDNADTIDDVVRVELWHAIALNRQMSSKIK